MEVLPKDIIRTWILPHLTQSRTGRPSRVDPIELLEAMLYKLKTGCQWRYLPVKQFFAGAALARRVRPVQRVAQRRVVEGSVAECTAAEQAQVGLFQCAT